MPDPPLTQQEREWREVVNRQYGGNKWKALTAREKARAEAAEAGLREALDLIEALSDLVGETMPNLSDHAPRMGAGEKMTLLGKANEIANRRDAFLSRHGRGVSE